MSGIGGKAVPLRVGVLGYLAVLERVAVPVARSQLGAGSAGQRLGPTLTADAPLVALALRTLAEAACTAVPQGSPAWTTEAIFNHPGDSAAAQASVRLLTARVDRLTLGEPCGAPLEWQVLHADREVTWYNDPAPALASLRGLPALDGPQRGWDHVYLDAYPWLAPALAPHLPIRAPHVWVNLGVTAQHEVAAAVAHWRGSVSGQLHVQISTAGRAGLADAADWAHLALQSGADLAVVTCAQHGLLLANGQCQVGQPALPVAAWADASGAGAAVSASLMASLIAARWRSDRAAGGAASHDELAQWAQLAAQAGQRQCMQDGALDASSHHHWQQALHAHALA